MIINCGKRRIVSDQYGWIIQRRHVMQSGKNKGEIIWKTDDPAYPNSLAKALEMIYERELKDRDEVGLSEVAKAAKEASHAVAEYMRVARNSA